MLNFIRSRQKSFELIALACVSYFSLYLKDSVSRKGYGELTSSAAAIVALVITITLTDLLRRWVLNSYVFDEKQGVRGNWIEYVKLGSEYRIAIFDIKYDLRDNNFRVKGNLFDPRLFDVSRSDQNLAVSSWNSVSFGFIEGDSNNIYYVYNSQDHEENRVTLGIARLTFLETNGKKWSGRGYIIESSPGTEAYSIGFERMDGELINRLIGKTSIENPVDRTSMIMKYWEYRLGSPNGR